jgi:hypothetical protein
MPIYGQNDGLEHLLLLLQNNSRGDNHKLIFLLAGPGVTGENKNYVFWHMENALRSSECGNRKYEPKERSINIPFGKYPKSKFPNGTFCDSHFHKGRSIAFTVDYINNFKQVILDSNDKNFAIFYKTDHQCLKDLNLSFIHFVTGPIMSDYDLESFVNAEDYQIYVAIMARKLENYMKEHAPNLEFDIVTFKPLNKEQIESNTPFMYKEAIEKYWSRELLELYKKHTSSKDFVPYGRDVLFKLKNNIDEMKISDE